MCYHPAVRGKAAAALMLTIVITYFIFLPWSVGRDSLPTDIDLRGAERVHPTSEVAKTALEDVGVIQTLDGSACGESNRSGREVPILIEGSADLPEYATDATVVLNGFRAEYLSGDHHLAQVSAVIGNIQRIGSQLRWDATGQLSDRNFDDGYRWCYFYTVIAWNRNEIDARVIGQRDALAFSPNRPDEDVALVTASAFLQDRSLTRGHRTAVLPDGISYSWERGDRHLLQIAFNLYGETFLQSGRRWSVPDPGDINSLASGVVSWEANAILKDNAVRRDYRFGVRAVVLAGTAVEVKQPPFTIIPKEDSGACLISPGGVRTEEQVVENVPFDYAVPMLTGWDLAHECNDEHVKEMGAWIHDISYEKAPESQTGTLRYSVSSVIRDSDSRPGQKFKHRVSILGLNRNI
ncbi:MAG: hypothetical protein NDI61_06445 [Bdellovibrionaceae bacterium]|nr:hypothetical protein [Pseudobdellovibrionaceae bacterium]